jgi:hypothetical protein
MLKNILSEEMSGNLSTLHYISDIFQGNNSPHCRPTSTSKGRHQRPGSGMKTVPWSDIFSLLSPTAYCQFLKIEKDVNFWGTFKRVLSCARGYFAPFEMWKDNFYISMHRAYSNLFSTPLKDIQQKTKNYAAGWCACKFCPFKHRERIN